MEDKILATHDEKIVQDFMESALTLKPNLSVSTLLTRARTRKQRHRVLIAGLAAAILLCLYTVSPFVMPAVARMLSAIPGAGSTFQEALIMHRLDLAYEAGFMPTLDKTMEQDGITFTVHTAYRDADSFELVVSLKGEQALIESMRKSIGPRIQIKSSWWRSPGHTSYKFYDEKESVLYVTISGREALPWYVRKLTVSAQWMTNAAEIDKYQTFADWEAVELSTPLALDFPLQSETNAASETVAIAKHLGDEISQIYLDSLTFSPVRTILKFTFKGGEPEFRLFDEHGSVLDALTYDATPEASQIKAVPTDSPTITIRYLGSWEESALEIPLQEGYEWENGASFRLESITPTHELLPWVRSDGNDVYADTKVILKWQGSKPNIQAQGGHINWHEDYAELLLSADLPQDAPLRLTLRTLQGEPQEFTIRR